VAAFLGPRWPNRARALELCGRAGVRLGCRPCGEATVVPYRCRCRTCRHAQQAGAAAMADRLTRRIRVHDLLMEAEPWDGRGRKKKRGWRLLTLTCPVSQDPEANWRWNELRSGVVDVRGAVSKFWRKTPWGAQVSDGAPMVDAAGDPVCYKRGAKAGQQRVRWFKRSRRDTSGVAFVEIGPKNAMPHAHMLVYGEYVPQAELQRAWSAALGRPAFVHISKVAEVADAVREVAKYVSKGTKEPLLDAKRAAGIELAFKHVHRGSILGALRSVKVDDQDGEIEDVRAEDVHDAKVAVCEGCGVVGEWVWVGVVNAESVRLNGGYGFVRDPSVLLDLPDLFRDLFTDGVDHGQPADAGPVHRDRLGGGAAGGGGYVGGNGGGGYLHHVPAGRD
jgi:hypothetical protein